MVGPPYILGKRYTEIPRAPSYFSTYFEEQMKREEDTDDGLKTLYIDRDPDTFSDICRHLQGQRAPINRTT